MISLVLSKETAHAINQSHVTRRTLTGNCLSIRTLKELRLIATYVNEFFIAGSYNNHNWSVQL